MYNTLYVYMSIGKWKRTNKQGSKEKKIQQQQKQKTKIN